MNLGSLLSMLGGMMGKGGGTTFSMPAAQGGGSLPAGTGVMASPSQPPAGGFSWGKLGQGMLDAQKAIVEQLRLMAQQGRGNLGERN